MLAAARRFLLAVPLVGAASAVVAADVPARLTVHWSDPEGQFRHGSERLAAEARAVLAPLGIALDWAAPDDTTDGPGHVRVILLARDRSAGRIGARAMACVQSGPGARSTAWIVVPRVRASLGFPAEPLPSEGPLLARALARVMAHEIVHLLLPRLPHAAGGLMNASLGRDALLAHDAPEVDASLGRALRGVL